MTFEYYKLSIDDSTYQQIRLFEDFLYNKQNGYVTFEATVRNLKHGPLLPSEVAPC